MATHTKHDHLSHSNEPISTGEIPVQPSPPSLLTQVGHFLRHFLEMCVAMCIAGNILNLLVFQGAALIGYPDLREQLPELSLLLITFNLSLPMIAWMRWRGMAWRPNLEMAGAAFGVAILLIGLVWLGVAPTSTLQISISRFCGLACAGMFIVMLFRLDLYTGRKGHHAHAM